MLFPEVPRVIYEASSLLEVICQLRFPAILKIDNEVPADFQDIIREEFPNFIDKAQISFGVGPLVKDQIESGALISELPSQSSKNYEFNSEGEKWKVNLARNFLALSSRDYKRWEEFKTYLNIPLNSLIGNYAPSHYSRIGLRYRNVIKRSAIGLDNIDWNELLQTHILGILDYSEVCKNVQSFENRHDIRLSENGDFVRLVTMLVRLDDDDDEVCFLIDADFYNIGRFDLEGSIEKLDYFNKEATRLFRWCISERLHEAMKPKIL